MALQTLHHLKFAKRAILAIISLAPDASVFLPVRVQSCATALSMFHVLAACGGQCNANEVSNYCGGGIRDGLSEMQSHPLWVGGPSNYLFATH